MSTEQFLTYQRFMNEQDARDLADLLKDNGVEFQWEDGTASFDPSFANNAVHKEFRVKLKPVDFQRADDLLLEQSSALLNEIEQDYYLFQFSDEELFEVLEKRDAWSKFDYLLAQKLLKERGKSFSIAELEAMRNRRIEELAKPDTGQTLWVAVGYVSVLFGGLFGVFLGWHLYSHKKTLPDGTRAYGYTEKDRKQGRIIFFLGLVSFLIFLFFRLTEY